MPKVADLFDKWQFLVENRLGEQQRGSGRRMTSEDWCREGARDA